MLKGKIAVVTGGSRGIGRAVCEKLASLGADIAFSYAGNAAAAEETAEACRALGVRVFSMQADVGKSEAVTAFFDAVMKEYGRVDILVNNAGITRDNLAMRMKEEEFDQVIETNLKGTFLCMKAVTRPMMKQRSGRIINLTSVVALRGNPGQVNYCASKAGVIGMTKSMAREVASRGITVNAIAPGFIETDMTAKLPEDIKTSMAAGIPMAHMGRPEDVANAVAFFASDEAAYVTGQVLCVDGGMAM